MKALELNLPRKLPLLSHARGNNLKVRSILRRGLDSHVNPAAQTSEHTPNDLREITEVLKDGAVCEYVQQQEQSPVRENLEPLLSNPRSWRLQRKKRFNSEVAPKKKKQSKALTVLCSVDLSAGTGTPQYFIAHNLFTGKLSPSQDASKRASRSREALPTSARRTLFNPARSLSSNWRKTRFSHSGAQESPKPIQALPLFRKLNLL